MERGGVARRPLGPLRVSLACLRGPPQQPPLRNLGLGWPGWPRKGRAGEAPWRRYTRRKDVIEAATALRGVAWRPPECAECGLLPRYSRIITASLRRDSEQTCRALSSRRDQRRLATPLQGPLLAGRGGAPGQACPRPPRSAPPRTREGHRCRARPIFGIWMR